MLLVFIDNSINYLQYLVSQPEASMLGFYIEQVEALERELTRSYETIKDNTPRWAKFGRALNSRAEALRDKTKSSELDMPSFDIGNAVGDLLVKGEYNRIVDLRGSVDKLSPIRNNYEESLQQQKTLKQ